MNKKTLTEADIRTKFITPAIIGENVKKWDVMTQILEEHYFTKGRVIVRGKTVQRGEAKKADYLLLYKPNIPIAVVEAKDNNQIVGAGMQQALGYAEILDVPLPPTPLPPILNLKPIRTSITKSQAKGIFDNESFGKIKVKMRLFQCLP